MADIAEAPNVYLKIGGIGYKSFVEQSVLDGPRSSEFEKAARPVYNV